GPYRVTKAVREVISLARDVMQGDRPGVRRLELEHPQLDGELRVRGGNREESFLDDVLQVAVRLQLRGGRRDEAAHRKTGPLQLLARSHPQARIFDDDAHGLEAVRKPADDAKLLLERDVHEVADRLDP